MKTESKYPEHDKLTAIQPLSQAQGEFIDWLSSEKKMRLGLWIEDDGHDLFVPATFRLADFLAEFHGINQSALETEKRAMLDECRRMNEAPKKTCPECGWTGPAVHFVASGVCQGCANCA